MQVKNAADTMSAFKNQRKINYRIQSGDNLYIRVISMDEKTNLFLNSMGGRAELSKYLNRCLCLPQ